MEIHKKRSGLCLRLPTPYSPLPIQHFARIAAVEGRCSDRCRLRERNDAAVIDGELAACPRNRADRRRQLIDVEFEPWRRDAQRTDGDVELRAFGMRADVAEAIARVADRRGGGS